MVMSQFFIFLLGEQESWFSDVTMRSQLAAAILLAVMVKLVLPSHHVGAPAMELHLPLTLGFINVICGGGGGGERRVENGERKGGKNSIRKGIKRGLREEGMLSHSFPRILSDQFYPITALLIRFAIHESGKVVLKPLLEL